MKQIIKLKVIFCLIMLMPAAGTAKQIDRIVAVVNNDIIMQSELKKALKTYKNKKMTLPKAASYRASVLEQLINNRLRRQIIKNIGIEVTPDMIEDSVSQIAAQNNMSIAELKSALPSQGLNMKKLRAKIKKDLEAAIFQQKVLKGRNAVSRQELKKAIRKQPKSVILGESPKYYHAAHILLAIADINDTQEISEKKIKAKKLLKKIKAGFDFAAAAKENSDSPIAESGGDLGWRLLKDYPKLIANAIKNMRQGAVKGPIKDDSGLHIIKLIETAGGVIRKEFSRAERKQQAMNILLQKKAERHIHKLLRRYRDEAYIERRL